jgi:hypothetical protein
VKADRQMFGTWSAHGEPPAEDQNNAAFVCLRLGTFTFVLILCQV